MASRIKGFAKRRHSWHSFGFRIPLENRPQLAVRLAFFAASRMPNTMIDAFAKRALDDESMTMMHYAGFYG